MSKLTLANWNDRAPRWERRRRQMAAPEPRDDLDLIKTILASAVTALGVSDEVEVKLDILYK